MNVAHELPANPVAFADEAETVEGGEPRELRPALPAVKAPPRRARGVESLSPFVAWSEEERAPLPPAETPGPSLVVELLREPAAIVERLLDPARVQTLVLAAVAMLVAGAAFFAATLGAARGADGLLLLAAYTATGLLAAIAAALGPIWAAGVLVAARVPLSRLVATLLSSVAPGAVLLAGLAPPILFAWRVDDEWAGPLGAVAAFAIAGLASGLRLRRLLLSMAETVVRTASGDSNARLSPADDFRVGIVARMATAFLAFTCALAFWAVDSLA